MKNDLSPDILPRFTDDEIEMIKCSADFFAIDVSPASTFRALGLA